MIALLYWSDNSHNSLLCRWRALEEFVRVEVVAGPPAKLTLPNWDLTQVPLYYIVTTYFKHLTILYPSPSYLSPHTFPPHAPPPSHPPLAPFPLTPFAPLPLPLTVHTPDIPLHHLLIIPPSPHTPSHTPPS